MQMMVNIVKNIFGVGAQKFCVSALCSPHLQNVLPILGAENTTQVDVSGIIGGLDSIIEGLGGLIVSWFFFISKFVFQIVDLVQYLVYKLAGINMSSQMTFDLPIFKVLLSDTVLDLFVAMFIIGLIFLIVFTIISIVKSEYAIAIGLESDPKVMYGLMRVIHLHTSSTSSGSTYLMRMQSDISRFLRSLTVRPLRL